MDARIKSGHDAVFAATAVKTLTHGGVVSPNAFR
jgi:hypothetical protein